MVSSLIAYCRGDQPIGCVNVGFGDNTESAEVTLRIKLQLVVRVQMQYLKLTVANKNSA